MLYPIVTVPRHTSAQLEQLGTKPKFWFRAEDGTLTLFKEGFEGSGEHWAAKLACEVAAALGLPHADYELAEFDGRLGVVSRNFVPMAGRLILGNELLAKVFTGYDENPDYRCPQHTLTRVMAVLRSPQVGPPLDWDCPAAWHAGAAGYWRQRLDAFSPTRLETIVQSMPTSAMSEIAGRFAVQVMIENRIRLLASE